MSRNLVSSANLPRPLSRRFSSLRGIACPTQSILVESLTICLESPIATPLANYQSISESASCQAVPTVRLRLRQAARKPAPHLATRLWCRSPLLQGQTWSPCSRSRPRRFLDLYIARAAVDSLRPGASSRRQLP